MPELADNCVVVNGVAKTYAMTGWRVGWMIGPTDLVKAATNLQSHATSNVSNVAQRAALAAVSGDLTAVDEMKAAFDRRRTTIVSMLNEIDGVVCPTPHGAFYAYPSVKGLLGKEHGGRGHRRRPPSWPSSSSTRPRSRSCPGEAFGSPGYLRLSYALGDDDLVEGVTRLQKLLQLTPASRARPVRCATPAEGAPAPALHRVDAARDPARAGRARRHPAARRARRRTGRRELSAADEKGWFRFQRLYDVARSVLRTEDDVRRLVREAAEDDVRDGGRWLEIQVDPSGYAARFGGITAFTDLVLDAVARRVASETGLGMAVVIAANRTRHPLDARTLARLAGAVRRPRRGRLRAVQRRAPRARTADFAPAFEIAERAGLLLAPHGGELRGPGPHRGSASTTCTPTGSGHGVRSAEDPALLDRIVDGRGRAGGLPGLQRGARRLLRPDVGAAARAAGGRRDGRARRRRPAAVRVAAGRPVRHDARRPRPHRRAAGRAGPDVGPGLARAGRREDAVLADIDAWLAAARAADSELAADQHRLVDQADAEPLLDPVADLAGQREQVVGGGAAAVGERERVLGGEADPGAVRSGRSPCRSRRARSARRRWS